MKGAEVSNQTEQRVSRGSLLRRAALLVGIGGAGALAAPAVAGAVTKTGQYTGNGTTTQINSGLAGLKVLWIFRVADRGPSVEAVTTNAIQSSFGAGTVLVGGRKEQGVSIEGAAFTVTYPDLNESGVLYHWAAFGD